MPWLFVKRPFKDFFSKQISVKNEETHENLMQRFGKKRVSANQLLNLLYNAIDERESEEEHRKVRFPGERKTELTLEELLEISHALNSFLKADPLEPERSGLDSKGTSVLKKIGAYSRAFFQKDAREYAQKLETISKNKACAQDAKKFLLKFTGFNPNIPKYEHDPEGKQDEKGLEPVNAEALKNGLLGKNTDLNGKQLKQDVLKKKKLVSSQTIVEAIALKPFFLKSDARVKHQASALDFLGSHLKGLLELNEIIQTGGYDQAHKYWIDALKNRVDAEIKDIWKMQNGVKQRKDAEEKWQAHLKKIAGE